MAEKLIQEIRSQFGECSICMSEFDERKCVPMLLQCQHSMCQNCIESNRQGRSLVCPFCKIKFTITKNNITETAIQKDRLRVSLLELLHQHTFEADRCCECSSQQNVLFCDICTYYHCEECDDIHQENCNLRKTLKTNLSDNCSKKNHYGSSLKYYCSTCHLLLCAMCAFEDHRGGEHDVNNLFLQYKSCVMVINSNILRLKKKLGRIEGIKRSITASERNVIKSRVEIEKHADFNDDLNIKEKLDFKIKAQEAERRILLQLKSSRRMCKELSENVVECCAIAKEMQQDVKQILSNEKYLREKCCELEEIDLKFDVKEIHGWQSFNQLTTDVQKPNKKHSLISNLRKLILKLSWKKRANTNTTSERKGHWQSSVIVLAIIGFGASLLIPRDDTSGSVSTVKYETNAFQRGCVKGSSFSTHPFPEGFQNCGQENSFYKYKGAFVNRSYTFHKDKCLGFKVQFVPLKSLIHDSDYRILTMEFGLSTGTVSAILLSGKGSDRKWGWKIIVNMTRNIYIDNNRGAIIKMQTNKNRLYKYKMCFTREKVVEIWSTNQNTLIDSISFHGVKRLTKFYPVFAIYETDEYTIGISLTATDINFNKSSIHSDIFVSNDGRSLNSHQKSDFYPNIDVKMAYVYTDEIRCPDEECYIPIDVYFYATKSIHCEVGILQVSTKPGRDRNKWHIPLFSIMPCSSVKQRWLFSDLCLLVHAGDRQKIYLIEGIWSPAKVKIYFDSMRKIYVQSSGGVNVTLSYEAIDDTYPRLYFRAPENESIVFDVGDHHLHDIQKINYLYLFVCRYFYHILWFLSLMLLLLDALFDKVVTRIDEDLT